jgi:hypothetical protein
MLADNHTAAPIATTNTITLTSSGARKHVLCTLYQRVRSEGVQRSASAMEAGGVRRRGRANPKRCM